MAASHRNAPPPRRGWLESHVRVSSKPHRGIKHEDKLTFLQQLSTLLNAGTPLLEALRLASDQSLSLKLRGVIRNIALKVSAGKSFHAACGTHEKIFPPHWIQIIHVGEMSGELALVLDQLSTQAQNAQETRSKLISAMIYPAIMAVVAVLCVVIMLWKVVPTFAQFFNDFNAKLPGITQRVLDLSNFLRDNGAMLCVGLVGAALLFRAWIARPSGRRAFNMIIMAVPVIGDLVVQAAMEKFASNMALLLRSGVPLLQALGILQSVMGSNEVYRRALEQSERRVGSGRTLAASIEETGIFTTMVVGMVRVGENSGQLADVLDQVAMYYRRKLSVALARAMSLVEPLIIVGMGCTVAVIMAAIYLPMFQLSSAVH